jgi:hypothetical protein
MWPAVLWLVAGVLLIAGEVLPEHKVTGGHIDPTRPGYPSPPRSPQQ